MQCKTSPGCSEMETAMQAVQHMRKLNLHPRQACAEWLAAVMLLNGRRAMAVTLRWPGRVRKAEQKRKDEEKDFLRVDSFGSDWCLPGIYHPPPPPPVPCCCNSKQPYAYTQMGCRQMHNRRHVSVQPHAIHRQVT